MKKIILISNQYSIIWGFPGGSGFSLKCKDLGSVPGLGRSPGERNGNPLQYSCLENPIDKGTWWASPWNRRVGHGLEANQTNSFNWCRGTPHPSTLLLLLGRKCLSVRRHSDHGGERGKYKNPLIIYHAQWLLLCCSDWISQRRASEFLLCGLCESHKSSAFIYLF